MKYFIFTLGCQQNVHDSLKLEKLFQILGFEKTAEKTADYIFVVACSVKESAVNRIFGRLNHWADKKVFITACVLPADIKRFEMKDIRFFDMNDLNSLKDILDIRVGGNLNQLADSQKDSGYLPIMTGCNNFCSYCAVPLTRGREKSRPADEIILEFQKLLKAGHREITLLGQNVNSFSSSFENEFIPSPEGDPLCRVEGSSINFPQLLKILNDLPGNFSLKFMTSHPKDMSDELINAIANLPKVTKEIHLPLQSGSNKILKLMNRHYTKKQYLDLVTRIRSKIPDVVLSTDIIVGFPGETDKDFKETVGVAKQANFKIAFISKYSVRKGTASEKLNDDVPQNVKRERFQILNELINQKENCVPI